MHTPYFLADIYKPKPKTVLFLGGGPNTVPTYVWNNYHPDGVYVVEKDVLTTKLAEKFFNLPNVNNFSIFHQDANSFIKKNKQKFEVIFFDLGLTRTRGTNKNDLKYLASEGGLSKLGKCIKKDGVLVYVVIARLNLPDLSFLREILSGLEKSFGSVFVFSNSPEKKNKIQSVIFLCVKNEVNFDKQLEKYRRSNVDSKKRSANEILLSNRVDLAGG